MQDKEVINNEVNNEEPIDDVFNDMLKDDEEVSDTESLIKNNFSKKKEPTAFEKTRIIQFILVGIFIAVLSVSIQFFMAYQFSKINSSSSLPLVKKLTEKMKELSNSLVEQNRVIGQLKIEKDSLEKKMNEEYSKLSNSNLGIRIRANQVQKEIKLYHPFSANVYNNGVVLMFQYYSKNSFLYVSGINFMKFRNFEVRNKKNQELFEIPSFLAIDSKIDINGNAALALVGKDEKIYRANVYFDYFVGHSGELNTIDHSAKTDRISFLLRDNYNMLLYDTSDGLKLVNCETQICSNSTFVLLSPNKVGQTNIHLYNNLPIISYHDLTTNSLKLLTCQTKLCDKYKVEIVENGSAFSHHLLITSEGPIIGYHSTKINKVKFWRNGQSKILTDGGLDLSMDLTIDGLPVMVYNYGDDLKFLKCSDVNCDKFESNTIRSRVKSPKVMNNRLLPMVLHDGGVIVCQNLKCH
eukprot:gene9937-2258_t